MARRSRHSAGARRGQFPSPPGVHRVWTKVDWCRSRKIGLELAPGETARLVCRPAFVLSLAPLYVTIWRARYIELERS